MPKHETIQKGSHVLNANELLVEALKLSAKERAVLAAALLRSLESNSAEEVERLWSIEAERRDAEIDAGVVDTRAIELVMRDLRSGR